MAFLIMNCVYFGLATEILGGEIDQGDDFSHLVNTSGEDDPELKQVGYDYTGVNQFF